MKNVKLTKHNEPSKQFYLLQILFKTEVPSECFKLKIFNSFFWYEKWRNERCYRMLIYCCYISLYLEKKCSLALSINCASIIIMTIMNYVIKM